MGLKYVWSIFDCFQYYLGAGGRVFFLRIKNDSDFVEKRVSENKLGGALLTGFWLFPSNKYPFFFDVFLDYSIYEFHKKGTIASKNTALNVTGPTVGLGVGYQF